MEGRSRAQSMHHMEASHAVNTRDVMMSATDDPERKGTKSSKSSTLEKVKTASGMKSLRGWRGRGSRNCLSLCSCLINTPSVVGPYVCLSYIVLCSDLVRDQR